MKSLVKVIFRQIKSSLGRYLAILAIVALGVGFFGGLKCTKPQMIKTLDDSLAETHFFDFRLLSTIGFEDKDIDSLKSKFSSMDDFVTVEGTYSVDALCDIEGASDSSPIAAAYRIHAITDEVNGIYIIDGRMPENDDECLVDNYMASINIGDCITISKDNEEDTLDLLKSYSLKVVGVCRSPYYINFERGTTTIGTGKLSGFIYVPKGEFDSEYYTEAYVKLKDKYGAYTDEYEDYIDENTENVENVLEEVINTRFDKLVSDAEKELQDAKDELKEKSEDAKKELDDAYTELIDGEKEIADNEKKIEDGKKSVKNAKATLNSKAKELADSKATLELNMSMLPDLNTPEGMMLSAMYNEITKGEEELTKQRKRLASEEKKLSDGEKELEDAKVEIADGWKEYEDGAREFEEETADAQKKIDDAQKDLDELEEPETYVLNRNTNIGYACYESDSNIVAAVANVFPIFFLLVAILICITTMNRMVEEQRTQIGIYKALGYRSSSIMFIFVFYAGSAALIGAVIGYALGTRFLPQAIWQGYNIMYNMGNTVAYKSVMSVAVCSIAAALLCAVGAAYFSVIYELKDVPANLIRPKSPKSGKRIFLEYIPFIWKRMKFLHKVSARNILRYKKRFFMMVVGISGCTALVLTGLGIGDSVKGIANLQYDTIQIYDIGVTFSDNASENDDSKSDDLKTEDSKNEDSKNNVLKNDASTNNDEENTYSKINDIDGVGETAFFRESTMDVSANSRTKSVTIIVPDNADDFMKFQVLNDNDTGETLTYPEKDEAVITMRISQALNVGPGDEIVVQDSELNTMKVRIKAICENYVYSYVFVNKETYLEQFSDSLIINSAWLNTDEEFDKREVSIELMKADDVMNVQVISDLEERIATMMQGMDFIVFIVIMCAAALALIVLYNLTNINITERAREIATIKVLGFYPNESAQYVFRENMVLTAVGALVGLPLGKALHAFIMYNIRIDMVSFKTYIAPKSYVFAILLTFGFAILVNFLMSFKINKINMAESLKSIE